MTDFNSLDPVEVLDAVNYHFPDEHIEDEDGDLDSENNVDNVAEVEPKVGMEFNSAEEIWYYYLAYGRHQGFMVAKRSSRKGKDNKLRDVVYECNKRGNGRSSRKDRLPIRPRPQIKLGCNAHISASVLPNGKWSIKTVQSVHNHDQSPGIGHEVHRSYKKHKMELSVKNEAMVEVAPRLLKEAEETPINGERPFSRQIYTGEGEEEESDVNQFFVVQSSTTEMLKPHGDRPRVDLRESKCQEIWKPWRRALIIKVLGLNVDFETMQKELSDLWSHIKGFELVELECGFLIVRFYSKVDYEWISKNGPWMILGHYLTVAHWRPYFVPSEKFFPVLSIWVRLLNPPIEFFHEDILLQIGNLLGVASKIDKNFPAKRSYARICVQVDLRKPLVPIVEVNELELQIGYEGLHEICFGCGKYGHRLEGCPTRETSMNALTPAVTSPFGPWMVVSI